MTVKGAMGETDDGISIHTALAGCDVKGAMGETDDGISIHTALAGCDVWSRSHLPDIPDFNPHSPRRL